MINNNNLKIAIVGDSLSGGGAEKVHGILSVYFQEKDIDVHNCVFVDWITYKYSGSIENIGKIAPNSFFIYRKIRRFIVFRDFIKKNDFDCVIDFRMRTNFLLEFLISNFVYPANTFYRVGSGILPFYMPQSVFLSSLIYKNRHIIAVSEGIKNEILIKNLANDVNYIHNPLDFKTIEQLKNEFDFETNKYIIAVGRMSDEIKQFDKLIISYSNSILPNNNVKLIILGEGENIGKYKKLTKCLDIEKFVEFIGFVNNPFPYYKKALFLVLCSTNEGFPNVINEALACETPIVAFDCFSGPSEIITDRENGLLVENQNFNKLTEGINEMLINKKLYLHCKQNAKRSVMRFSVNQIGERWLQLFNKNG
jgi:glycosyltransferase involved in cell wall biosynthesis